MKRFIAVLLAIVLSLSVFAVLTGCGEDSDYNETKGDLAFSEVVNKIDLQEGITVSTQVDATVDGEAFSVEGLIKLLCSKDDLKMDCALNSKLNGTFNGEAYFRNNDVYLSTETDEGRKYIKEDIDIKEDLGMDFSQYLTLMMSSREFSLDYNILDSEILFFKNDNGYKAEFDLIALATRVLNKVESAVDILSVDTTFKQLYDKIEGDKLLKKVFGTKKGREYYDAWRQEIKNIPEGVIPEEYAMFIKSLPTDVDAFISMLKSLVSMIGGSNPDGVTIYGTFIKNLINDLPEMGDKTMAEYVKEVIKGYFDMTVFDIAIKMTGAGADMPQEALDELKKELNTQLDTIKSMIKSTLSQIKSALASSKFKLDFTANAEGQLTDVVIDISVTEELSALLSGKIGGLVGYDAAPNIVFALKATFGVQSGASDFVDVSKLELYEVMPPVADLSAYIEQVKNEAVALINSDTDHSLYGEAEFGWCVKALVDNSGVIQKIEIVAVKDVNEIYEQLLDGNGGIAIDGVASELEDGSGYMVYCFIPGEYTPGEYIRLIPVE